MLEANPEAHALGSEADPHPHGEAVPDIAIDRQGWGAVQPKAAVEAALRNDRVDSFVHGSGRRGRGRQGGREANRADAREVAAGQADRRVGGMVTSPRGDAQEQPKERGREGAARGAAAQRTGALASCEKGHVANKVGHPGAVSAIDDGVDESGAVYLVMELLSGKSLAQRIRKAGSSSRKKCSSSRKAFSTCSRRRTRRTWCTAT